MRFALAFVWLPMLVTWLATMALLAATPPEGAAHRWLDANRWWVLWPVLALYVGVAGVWVLTPIVLVVGVVLHRLDAAGLDLTNRRRMVNVSVDRPSRVRPAG